MIAVPALAALSVVAGGNRVLFESLSATDSGTQLRAAYAFAHLHDAGSTTDVDQVRNLLLSGSPAQQKAASDGLLHRHWEGGVPDPVAEMIWHPTIRPRGGASPGAPIDPLRLLRPEKAAEILRRLPGKTAEEVERWMRQGDPQFRRADMERTGEWDRQRFKFMERPRASPPCFEQCLVELGTLAWLGMDMGPILEIRKPKTTEVDWWTGVLFRYLSAAAGDERAVSELVAMQPGIVAVQPRMALLAWLVTLPPGLEIHPKVRPLVVRAAMDPDAILRRLGIDMLALAPELYRAAGAEEALAAALKDWNPDTRVRAAAALWDAAPLSPASAALVEAALRGEHDPVVAAVEREALARGR